MKYEWLDGYLLEKPGAHKDYKPEWDAARYMIRGKMFVMFGGDKYGKPIYTFKLEPGFGQFLRQQYKDIVPGYYMNKDHWSSLYVGGDVTDSVVKEMADMAYNVLLATLPQKTQKEIASEE